MGNICSSHDLANLEDHPSHKTSIPHELEITSLLTSESSESFYTDYNVDVKPIDVSPYSELSKCYKVSSKKQRSVKISSKFHLLSSITNDNIIPEHFDLLKQSKLKNSVKLYKLYESKDSYFVVQEHIKEGSIRDVLKSSLLSEEISSKILSQVINFMLDLLKKNLKTCDILPQNILVSNLETWQVKINLFCFRCFIKEDFFRISKNKATWNLAFLLWFFLTGKSLSKHPDFTKEKLWISLSPACQDLLTRLTSCKISIIEAVTHPWLINNS